ncbi:hypothetical protein [Vibrio owensii]|uniref:hypothetical protein n=1 Tax=Vibrio harveyi group TaxID=717610 RepID=UPI003CC52A0B
MYGIPGEPSSRETGKYVLVDYDDTFSLNPELFKKIWELLQSAGFIVKCCTARSKIDCDNSDLLEHISENDVFFCEGYQKREYLEKTYNIGASDIAFWIDDFPESIVALSFDEVPSK